MIFPFDSNEDRYKDVGFKYQGAYVGIKKEGLAPRVWKVDVASMYPSILVSLNLGPDTTHFLKWRDGIEPMEVKQLTNSVILRLPDENFKKTAIIKIDTGEEGFLKHKMLELFKIRKEIKRQIPEAKDQKEKDKLKAQSNAIKVILNCFSGDTDVVTKDGIKKVKDCKIGDEIYTLNPETFQMEISKVTKTQIYDSKEIYSIKGETLDFLVTGNHRFFVANQYDSNYRFQTVDEMLNSYSSWLPMHKQQNGKKPLYYSLWDYVKNDEFVYFRSNTKACHDYKITRNKIFNHSQIGRYYTVLKSNISNPEQFEIQYDGKLFL